MPTLTPLTDPTTAGIAVPALAGNPDLARLIDVATDAISAYCHTYFSPTAVSEVFNSGDVGGRLFLSFRPVVSITTLTVGIQAPQVLDSTMYQLDPAKGELRFGGSGQNFYPDSGYGAWGGWSGYGGGYGGCSGGFQDIAVAYVAGYAAPPPSVVQACIEMLKVTAENMLADGSLKAESTPSYSYSLADLTRSAITAPSVVALLRPYWSPR